ncbi:hypothetical protein Taro_038876 [Colocasia esculenta]|uniref:TFIIS central domain-containing protein n=1 Tax=Colocasia esculenta TaxID=4460 RepID=A0A843WNH4_COLES|nr:hypothetical protein [Colocasia esculenta]
MEKGCRLRRQRTKSQLPVALAAEDTWSICFVAPFLCSPPSLGQWLVSSFSPPSSLAWPKLGSLSPAAKMEKRRLPQVSDHNEEESKETTLGGAGNDPGEPKKARRVEVEGAETGQRNEGKAEEEEEDGRGGSGAPEDANTAWGAAEDSGKQSTLPVDAPADDGRSSRAPDTVIPAIVALERTAHDALGSDFRKYNQKMRQLDFNLKNNALLAKRFLKMELEPLVILNMAPQELKITDTKCLRCMEKRVGVVDIIHAGGSGDRYQLECAACGHTWTATADAISSLTIEPPSIVDKVGAAPWATAKFEDVEKRLLSPHESDAIDLFQKTTAPYVPVLEDDHHHT